MMQLYLLDDATMFVKKFGRSIVYLVVYVGDPLMIGNNESYIASIKKVLKKGYAMTNLGHLHYYLGIEVTQNPKYIFISQKKYIGELLNKFGMTKCNPLSTPMEQNLKLTSKKGMNLRVQPIIGNLLGVLSTLSSPDRIFHLLLGSFPGSCKNFVKDICLLQKGF